MRRLALAMLGALACVSVAKDAAAQDYGLFLNPIEERAIGKQVHAQLMGTKYFAYPDLKLAAYVENIGRACARASARYPEQFVFTLLDNAEPNAAAAIGGFVYWHTGMFLWINDEAEMVAVMGHEVGHAIKRHGAREMNRQNVAGSLIKLMALRRRDPAQYEQMQVKAALALRAYDRDQETESDAIGANLLGPLGYDPFGAPRMTYQLNMIGRYFEAVTGKPDSTPVEWRKHPPVWNASRPRWKLPRMESSAPCPVTGNAISR